MKQLITIIIILLLFVINRFAGDELNSGKTDLNSNSIASLLLGLQSENLGLKTSCAYLLGELRVTEAIVPLMKVLRTDKNEEARIASALALYKINTLMSINAVKQSGRFDESDRVSKLAQNFYNQYLRNKSGIDVSGKDSIDVAIK